MKHAVVKAVVLIALILTQRVSADTMSMITIEAKSKEQRDKIATTGVAIDGILSDSVTVFGREREIELLRKLGFPMEVRELPDRPLDDFPSGDQKFHNYRELLSDLEQLATDYSDLVTRVLIGRSLEGRQLAGVRISSNPKSDSLPTALFFGAHHAREHLSVEVPLMLAKHLAANYHSDARIKKLLDTTEVWIVPLVNPDGSEYDIQTGKYQYWRKNRAHNSNGSMGVDLNRNYSKNFGGAGSSNNPNDETYHGPSAFSEPETRAVRDFVRARTKTTVLLTFHTFSELVMWPWGYTNGAVANAQHRQVFETMGRKMAQWNHYTPQKASALYLASGDTTDWAYDEKKIFAFTFELSPNSVSSLGFYPGASAIEPTFAANLEPSLYLIENAVNPVAVLREDADDWYGLP